VLAISPGAIRRARRPDRAAAGTTSTALPGVSLGETAILFRLLADAEVAEDDIEEIFDIDGTGDAAEAAQGKTKILRA
jgi:hypothetical protein